MPETKIGKRKTEEQFKHELESITTSTKSETVKEILRPDDYRLAFVNVDDYSLDNLDNLF